MIRPNHKKGANSDAALNGSGRAVIYGCDSELGLKYLIYCDQVPAKLICGPKTFRFSLMIPIRFF